MRMTLIAPGLQNVDLIKEGAVPFMFYKHIGYDVTIVSHKIGDYPYLESIVKGIHLKFINRTRIKKGSNPRSLFNISRNSIVQYLKENAKNIDVLHLTGFSKETFVYAFYYKKYNKNGLCYAKCDTDYGIVHIDYLENALKRYFLKYFFNKVDFYSVESSPVLKSLLEKYPGILKGLLKFPVPYVFIPPDLFQKEIKKEKIILTVARIGTYQKNTELLLRAFSKLKRNDWKLVLIGPIDNPEFNEEFKTLLEQNPDLELRVELAGNIADREELFDWYRKASIFCLPSRHESFGVALLESAYFECYPVTTGIQEMPAAFDITNNWKFGVQFPSDNEEELIKVLTHITSPGFENELRQVSSDLSNHIKTNFDGKSVVEKIHRTFTNYLKRLQ